ncbi:hypothetical protein ACT6QG_05500 [Xanthobacter sp. TB0136]|uniref:hypothetical protein n=1 Tax=Xanthobacter sp. TB0136 TaxID=3459177 RepID=UPI00403A3851
MAEFISDERATTGRRLTIIPSGRRMTELDFDELVLKRRIVEQRDGLLPDTSQSWRLA